MSHFHCWLLNLLSKQSTEMDTGPIPNVFQHIKREFCTIKRQFYCSLSQGQVSSLYTINPSLCNRFLVPATRDFVSERWGLWSFIGECQCNVWASEEFLGSTLWKAPEFLIYFSVCLKWGWGMGIPSESILMRSPLTDGTGLLNVTLSVLL